MIEEERRNLIEVLNESLLAVKKENIILLKDLSNRTLHAASVYQEHHYITVAVLVYSLSKIFERSNFRSYKDWDLFYDNVIDGLTNMINHLGSDDTKKFEKELSNLFKIMNRLESKLKYYIQEVIDHARINKASRIYEHGLSVGKTAELLGISQWELMDYIGQTGIADVKYSITLDVKKRLDYARSLFK